MSASSLSCRMCEVSFQHADEQRQHMKSESHVYQLRSRIAVPGSIVTPLGGDVSQSDDLEDERPGRQIPNPNESDSGEEDGLSEADDNDPSEAVPDFVADQCLFCGVSSGTFDASVAHMHKTHSFIIPYQSSLAVDLETIVWYLHLVVYGYHECLLCGKRRSSLEAVQQHMTAKGHCRFDPSDDFADFYDLASLQGEEHVAARPDEGSMRLQSGKLLTHRAHMHTTNSRSTLGSNTQEKQQQQQQNLPTSHEKGSSSEIVSRQDRRLGAYAMQLSQLSGQDQRSLAHLTLGEQRSVLAIRKQQLDKAQREERRARSKVERLGNRTLMKHFKPDVPGRSNG